MMKFIINSLTSKGKSHLQNEDSYICNDKFIAIADGMGGECDGEIASKIAITVINKILSDKINSCEILSLQDEEVCKLLFDAINKADNEIISYISSHPDSFGMGTTSIIILKQGNKMNIAWCGDSRCYVYNPVFGIRSLTKDQSLVQNLIDAGDITIEESYTHPDSNLITCYVGGGEDTCRPDFMVYEMKSNDILIACSDGLSGYCLDYDIECRIRESCDMKRLPENLAKLALEHGSDDDITIITLSLQQSSKSEKSIVKWLKKVVLHK